MGEDKPGVDDVMSYKDLAVYLKMAEGTLRHYVMAQTIPFVKVGAHVRFLKREIDTWLKERQRCPVDKGMARAGRDKGGELPWA
jgi:excisionase family DNA binding protein